MSPLGRLGQLPIALPLFLLVLTTIYLAGAVQIRAQVSSEGLVGPNFLPLLAAAGMYLCLALILAGELRRPATEVAAPADGGDDLALAWLVVLTTAAFIALFQLLGYFLSTALLTAALFRIFGFARGRPLPFALGVAGITLLFYLFYGVLFDVRLPLFPGE